MPTSPDATKHSRRLWDRKARLYDLLTAPMERMLGLVQGRAWVFERPMTGRMLEVGAGTGKNLAYYPDGAVVVFGEVEEFTPVVATLTPESKIQSVTVQDSRSRKIEPKRNKP